MLSIHPVSRVLFIVATFLMRLLLGGLVWVRIKVLSGSLFCYFVDGPNVLHMLSNRVMALELKSSLICPFRMYSSSQSAR